LGGNIGIVVEKNEDGRVQHEASLKKPAKTFQIRARVLGSIGKMQWV